MKTADLISLHGGHSGQFCNHAKDTLEEIIEQYVRLGFRQVGITEHIPPPENRFVYPDEKAAGLNAADIYARFRNYMTAVKSLKKKYAPQIVIYAGMETEACSGYADHVKHLVREFQPDYMVGSVHHVGDICFDYSGEDYKRAAAFFGSLDRMYEAYFDLQHEMIKTLKPFVVGHFDIIRIYDPDYRKRMEQPKIKAKIIRNLELIQALGLVLDFNQRPLQKGQAEPYISSSLLDLAKEMKIRVVPGDDSHCIGEAGNFIADAVHTLQAMGFDTLWPEPVLFADV